jgi:predicted transcriptional regulator of viral defense system
MNAKTNDVIDLARQRGQVSAGDAESIGACRTTLAYLARRGLLRRLARGVYVQSEQILASETFQRVAHAAPRGVICLLSALQFHELTTQMPMETWVAVERRGPIPKCRDLRVRVVRLRQKYFQLGIEKHVLQGTTVRVYSPGKTVVDCFRFRNRIGLDVAREALRDSLAQGKTTRDELYQLAGRCRILPVMRPYLEMV